MEPNTEAFQRYRDAPDERESLSYRLTNVILLMVGAILIIIGVSTVAFAAITLFFR